MIRAYKPADKASLLQMLKQHIPEYFAPAELDDFAEYLEQHREDYFVVEEEGQILGAGGINYFPKENTARISWDLIHPNAQGKGIGKALTLHRIDHIKGQGKFHTIEVRTSQLAFGFYEKCGFELEKVEKDFWAKGYDLYQMKMSNF